VGALLALGAAGFAWRGSMRLAALFVVGAGFGLTLQHALFGFASAWRAFLVERRGAGLRAQFLMLGVACILFFPVLARGHVFGQSVHPDLAPLGPSVLVGAFVFGIGSQLAGGCASGMLYTIGGGSGRMLLALVAAIFGSVLGALHLPWWETLAWHAPVSLVASVGWRAALFMNLVVFVAAFALTTVLERRRHGRLLPSGPSLPFVGRSGLARVLRGPWPIAAGAFALAALNFATLVLAGRPWGVTSALALWGSKALAAVGVDVASWSYWAPAARAQALGRSVLLDVTSVMDFGVVFGALFAAVLAGNFVVKWRLGARAVGSALLGGVLLGYGARLAYGCNVGAFFGGIASSSLHGWMWFLAALVGSAIGARLRAVLDPPPASSRVPEPVRPESAGTPLAA
jgi:uncharacterized membrane protein YedE/YeeE